MIPASFFGMPLGLLALGIAWRNATKIWDVPPQIGLFLIWLGAVLWGVLFLAYLAKWIWRSAAAKTEFEHPVQCCFIGLAGVVASLASIGLAPYVPSLGFGLMFLGAAWTLVFAFYRTGRLWMGDRHPETTTPVLYLPTVAGGLVTGSAAAVLGYPEWGQLAFGGGFFAWLAIESVVLHRLYTAPMMPAPLRPILGIQLAPPSVAAVAYLNVGGGGHDFFVYALIGYAMLQALILLRLWPWLRQAGATPAWWSFSFGAAALPTAAIVLVARGDTGPAAVLAPWLFVAANLVVVAIAAMTLFLMFSGRLMPAPSVGAAAAPVATKP
jgi:tellurite resistance protein